MLYQMYIEMLYSISKSCDLLLALEEKSVSVGTHCLGIMNVSTLPQISWQSIK